MKRLFILITFVCVSVASFADYDKFYYYDIYKQADKITSVDNFWEELLKVNKNYLKLKKSFKKGTHSMRAAYAEYDVMNGDILPLHSKYTKARLDMALSDSLMIWMKLNKVKNLNIPDLYILPLDFYNAASYPYETKIVVFTEAITNLLDKDELIACTAHELAHYYLRHQLGHMYKLKKKESSNRFWASFGTALYAGVMAGANMYGASQGAEPLDVDYGALISNANDLFKETSAKATEMYSFRYSREQELEADIIALAFLHKSGIDENKIISMLKKLQPYSSEVRDKHDDHPLISERIKMLEKIIDKFIK